MYILSYYNQYKHNIRNRANKQTQKYYTSLLAPKNIMMDQNAIGKKYIHIFSFKMLITIKIN